MLRAVPAQRAAATCPTCPQPDPPHGRPTRRMRTKPRRTRHPPQRQQFVCRRRCPLWPPCPHHAVLQSPRWRARQRRSTASARRATPSSRGPWRLHRPRPRLRSWGRRAGCPGEGFQPGPSVRTPSQAQCQAAVGCPLEAADFRRTGSVVLPQPAEPEPGVDAAIRVQPPRATAFLPCDIDDRPGDPGRPVVQRKHVEGARLRAGRCDGGTPAQREQAVRQPVRGETQDHGAKSVGSLTPAHDPRTSGSVDTQCGRAFVVGSERKHHGAPVAELRVESPVGIAAFEQVAVSGAGGILDDAPLQAARCRRIP